MFPMVGQVHEWREARAMVERLRGNPGRRPATGHHGRGAFRRPAGALAREVDFSIGTNDLTQYTLAIDRGHPSLSAQADGLHPAVLSLIDMTVRAAHAQGKWVGVCGELAADPQAVAVLLGLDVDELSVAARSIAEVKALVRQADHRQPAPWRAKPCNRTAPQRFARWWSVTEWPRSSPLPSTRRWISPSAWTPAPVQVNRSQAQHSAAGKG
jgi:phosphoenolpyruvate-protein kinase (PTS system EI component)